MNDINMKRNNISVIKMLFFFVAAICAAIPFAFVSKNNDFLVIGVCLVIELVVYLITNNATIGRMFNFATIFICALFVFHFGQVIILGFFPAMIQKYNMRIVLTYFDVESCLSALRIINVAFVALMMGTLAKSRHTFVLGNHSVRNDDDDGIARWARLIILLTFPVKIPIDLLLIYKSFTQSFITASHWLQAFPNYVRAYGNISLIGFALLVVALRKDKKKQNIAFLFIVGYLLLLMLSGWRSENVSYLIVIAYLYVCTRTEKLKIRKLLVIGIAGYFLLAVLYTVVAVRFSLDRSFDAYYEAFMRVLTGDKNVIFESLREYGNTGYTAICVLKKWLPIHGASLGKSYFFGVSAVFPNIGGLAGRLTTEAAFALDLQQGGAVFSEYANIGGSIIGEFFFNFGIIGGIIFSYFIGRLIGKVGVKVKQYLEEDNLAGIAYYIPVMFSTLYWIRDSFGGGIRDVVWGIAFCYLIRRMQLRS